MPPYCENIRTFVEYFLPEWIDDVVVKPKDKYINFAFPNIYAPTMDRGGEDQRFEPGGGGGNSGSAGGAQKEYHDPTVVVPDGQCVIGSIAAALQVKFGYSDADAIAKAKSAIEKITGEDLSTITDKGISISGEQRANALRELGFNVVELRGSVGESFFVSHFNNGGFGIGNWGDIPGYAGHDVLLTGWNSGPNTFDYYDSTLGKTLTGNPNNAIFYFN